MYSRYPKLLGLLVILVLFTASPQVPAETSYSGDRLVGTTLILSHLRSLSDQTNTGLKLNGVFGISNNGTHLFTTQTTNRITIHDLNGNYISTFLSTAGIGDGELNVPTGALDNGTHILVLDNGNERVQIFDREGNYLDQFGDNTFFNLPVYMDHNGTHIFVLDLNNDNLQLFDAAGNFVTELIGSVDLDSPFGMHITDDRIYITDGGVNDDINVFYRNGTAISRFGYQSPGDLPMTSTGGLAMYEDFIFVAENTRIGIFDTSGQAHAPVYHSIDSVPFVNLASLTIVGDRLYVADETGDAIHIYAINVVDATAIANDNVVHLSWGSPSVYDGANVTHFNIYRGSESGNYDLIATIDSSTMSYNDYTVQAGEIYYYAVTAGNDFGETQHSDEMNVTTPVQQGSGGSGGTTVTDTVTETITESSSDNPLPLNLLLLPAAFIAMIVFRRQN